MVDVKDRDQIGELHASFHVGHSLLQCGFLVGLRPFPVGYDELIGDLSANRRIQMPIIILSFSGFDFHHISTGECDDVGRSACSLADD